MTIRRDHSPKSRRRARRSKDKRGAAKLTPKRARLAEKRRHEDLSVEGMSEMVDEIFNQA